MLLILLMLLVWLLLVAVWYQTCATGAIAGASVMTVAAAICG